MNCVSSDLHISTGFTSSNTHGGSVCGTQEWILAVHIRDSGGNTHHVIGAALQTFPYQVTFFAQ